MSRNIAWARQQETEQPKPLFQDPYAKALLKTAPADFQIPPEVDVLLDVLATKYIDEMLLNATGMVGLNGIAQGDYNQVVLLGDAMDTRPFRLPWPQGTVLYVVASSESHELAEAVLTHHAAKVPPGCMLRRVNARLQAGGEVGFCEELQRQGFRGDRLSVWGVQGLHELGLSGAELSCLLVEVSGCAAYHSLVLGELPAMEEAVARNLLADSGLLATVLPWDHEELSYGRWQADVRAQLPSSCRRRFSAQQLRLSDAQVDSYGVHVAAAMEADEDFFGNFS